jgi:two-component system chemotaxis response regulator CheB
MRSYEIIVIGASLGGLQALMIVLGGLPPEFALPIAITQHRARDQGSGLAAFLQSYSAMPIQEVEDKQPIVPGQVYLAPADYHLLVEAGSFALSTEAPLLAARPSIDMLFESAADAYAERTIGVILTGASDDGALGLAAIARRGGCVLVQEPATAASDVMPLAAIAAAGNARVLPLEQIAPLLIEISGQ